MHSMTFSSITSFYPLDAGTHHPTCYNQKCCQRLPSVPWEAKLPQIETTEVELYTLTHKDIHSILLRGGKGRHRTA